MPRPTPRLALLLAALLVLPAAAAGQNPYAGSIIIPAYPFSNVPQIQMVPPAPVSSINKTLEEVARSLEITGSSFNQFIPRVNVWGTFTPMVLFGTTAGPTGSATFQVMSDTLIRVPAIPADAVNGKIALVYRRVTSWSPNQPAYVKVGESSARFTVGAGLKLINTHATRNLDFADVGYDLGNGWIVMSLIDPSQPNPARRLLTPFNQAGSISPRIVVPADVPLDLEYRHATGTFQAVPLFTLPRGTRWFLGLPSGALTLE